MALYFYPDFDWNFELFTSGLKSQKRIFSYVCNKLGKENVIWNYKHPKLIFQNGRRMELDIFVPSKNFAIEYQGEQHYLSMDHLGGEKELKKIQKRDEAKRIACKTFEIQLLEIPYFELKPLEVIKAAIRDL